MYIIYIYIILYYIYIYIILYYIYILDLSDDTIVSVLRVQGFKARPSPIKCTGQGLLLPRDGLQLVIDFLQGRVNMYQKWSQGKLLATKRSMFNLYVFARHAFSIAFHPHAATAGPVALARAMGFLLREKHPDVVGNVTANSPYLLLITPP